MRRTLSQPRPSFGSWSTEHLKVWPLEIWEETVPPFQIRETPAIVLLEVWFVAVLNDGLAYLALSRSNSNLLKNDAKAM